MPLLAARGVYAGYGDGDVLHGVDLAVHPGELVAVLGPNGAGKSTLLRVLSGFLRPRAGTVELNGVPCTGHPPSELARCGLYAVPEGRAVFPNLTVAENLRMATARPERQWAEALDRTLARFPRLAERSTQPAGTMSGGEQQMLALARAFVAAPSVLLLDEPSLGLAPRVVDEVFEAIAEFRAASVAVVLVEQYVHRALAVADRAMVLAKGELRFVGAPADLDADVLAHGYLAGPADAAPTSTRRSRT